MAKHHAITKIIAHVAGNEEVIVGIVSDAFVKKPTGSKLIATVRKRAPDISDLMFDEGAINFLVPKYKVTGASEPYTKQVRISADIRKTLEWKKAHLAKLILDTAKKINDLGEIKVKSLSLRKSEGETLSSNEQTDIDDFLTERNTIKNADFHDTAETENYSRYKSKLAVAGTHVTLKRFPTGWAVDDVITILDRGTDVKEYQVTLTAVNSGNKTIDFLDPGHATNFKRLTSFAFKATV